MTASSDYPAEAPQLRAMALLADMRTELDELIAEKITALAGHSHWPGDLDPLAYASLDLEITALLRQLIENADETDCSRPAFAIVETLEPEAPKPLLRRARSCFTSVFPGFWRPDGTWRDGDGVPAGERLAEHIESTLEEDGGERLTLELTIQSINGGQLAGPRTYHRSDLPDLGGELVLPIDPIAAERIEARVRALRDEAAAKLQAGGWLAPARDLRQGLVPRVIIGRVEGTGDYSAYRREAIAILRRLARATEEATRNTP